MIAPRLVLLLAATLWMAACAAPSPAPEREWPAPSPALWEIGPEGAPTGWLMGTVHALPAGLDWRTEQLEIALSTAGVLVAEIAALDNAAAAGAAFEAVANRPGLPPLVERVSPADRPALQTLMERARMGERSLAMRKTWAAALILANATRRYDPALGIDRALLAQARRVEGLETHADQFARFDGLSENAQAELLNSVAEDALTDDQDARIEAWLTGDIARLEALSQGRLLSHPELREALVDSRNRAWVERILRLVEQGERPFVAVGAGHMLGEQGLPTLLTKRGLAIRRVQ